MRGSCPWLDSLAQDSSARREIFKTITEVKKDSDLGGETGHWIRTESPMQIYTYTLKWELMTATKGWEHWLFT